MFQWIYNCIGKEEAVEFEYQSVTNGFISLNLIVRGIIFEDEILVFKLLNVVIFNCEFRRSQLLTLKFFI